ncbi:MAG TPA: NAD(P)-dependent oxidoreductase [Actinomycetota bacterium]|nr:NAD(P)-dependent oxidoreductase [Actinomycetota bacterium]
MAFGYPVLLELAGRRAVVVGEAAVAAGKVEGLLAAGAAVTVVAPGPASELDRLAVEPGVTVRRRHYLPGDLAGAFLCVAGSADAALRSAVAAEARAAGVLVNVMDDVPNCDFAAPAVLRRGDLVVAVGTGGRAPALASRVRAELGERFGPEWAELVDLVGEVRAATLGDLPDLEERARRWRAALDLAELERLVRAGRRDLAAQHLNARLLAPEGSGEPQGGAPVDREGA